ncbi:hypothetical protein L1049_025184 [Liquidambar formosana]|uniref:F-box domain-containing protein n=1 Tax=Liquidambar formosana TaxID=63359 RepID=A0AAP0X0C1_LIQFO
MEPSRVETTLKFLILQHGNAKATTVYKESQKANMSEKRTRTTYQQRRTRDYMSKLPHYVVMDIFCKLPLKSLLSCRFVCKAWRDLISDPCFATLHLAKAPAILMFQIGNFEILGETNIFMVEPEANHPDAITKVNMGFNIPKSDAKIIGSCNGLLCLWDDLSPDSFYISNPVTGECMTLPKIKRGPKHLSASGFGISSKTKQYKVITMTYRQVLSHELEAQIHTVGSGTWRTIGHVPYDFSCALSGIFLNGALHWIARDDNKSGLLCAFDIENEQFLTIPLPPISFFGRKIDWSNLGVLGGCLCVFASGENLFFFYSKLEMWVLKDYGVKDSWTKALVEDPVAKHRWDKIWLELIRNKESLVLSYENYLVYYDPRTKRLRKLYICGTQSRIKVFPHIPRFLSLEAIMLGESSKVLNIKSR